MPVIVTALMKWTRY